MKFEFDPIKSAANLAKHGIDFVAAQALWKGDVTAFPARAGAGGEARQAMIGKIGDVYWTAITTRRGEAIRLICVRRSRDNERRLYDEA